MKDFVEIDGRQYRVEFNFNAIGDFCAIKGAGLDVFERFSELGINDLILLFHCGIVEGERLEGRDCDLTLRDLGAVIDASDFEHVAEIIERHYAGRAQGAEGGKTGSEAKKKTRWLSR